MLESLFNKVAGLKEIFKSSFFYWTPPVAASGNGKTLHRLSIFYYHDLPKCSVFISQYSNMLLSSFFTSSFCFSIYILKVKLRLLLIQMEDQICSPEKYSMKNSYDKNIFYLNENIFIYHESWYNENTFYWIQICFNIMKIYIF